MDASSLPYFTQRENDTDGRPDMDGRSSFAPSESDCSTLMDLKKRVRELDGMLKDLESRQSDDDDDEQDDIYDDQDSDSDISNSELYNIQDLENNDVMGTFEAPPEGKLRQTLDAVDMVHSLSSLFVRQQLTSENDIRASFAGVMEQIAPSEPSLSEIDVSSQDDSPDPNEMTANKQDNRILYAQILLIVFAVTTIALIAVYVSIRL
jgi:hypothetical protein